MNSAVGLFVLFIISARKVLYVFGVLIAVCLVLLPCDAVLLKRNVEEAKRREHRAIRVDSLVGGINGKDAFLVPFNLVFVDIVILPLNAQKVAVYI